MKVRFWNNLPLWAHSIKLFHNNRSSCSNSSWPGGLRTFTDSTEPSIGFSHFLCCVKPVRQCWEQESRRRPEPCGEEHQWSKFYPVCVCVCSSQCGAICVASNRSPFLCPFLHSLCPQTFLSCTPLPPPLAAATAAAAQPTYNPLSSSILLAIPIEIFNSPVVLMSRPYWHIWQADVHRKFHKRGSWSQAQWSSWNFEKHCRRSLRSPIF